MADINSKISKGMLGTKLGMTQVWNESGKLVPLDVKKGDRVLFNKYSGNEVTVDGEELLIIREEDVLAICE